MKHTKSCVRNWKGLSSDHSTSPASSSARCTIAWLHDKSGPVLRNSPVSMAMDRTAKMLVSCVLSTIRSMKKWNGRICWTSWHLQYLTYHKKTQSYSEHSELVLFPPKPDLPHAPPFLSSSWTKNIKLKPFRPSRANFWLYSHSWGCVNSSSLQTGQILGETWSAWFEGYGNSVFIHQKPCPAPQNRGPNCDGPAAVVHWTAGMACDKLHKMAMKHKSRMQGRKTTSKHNK